MNDLGEKSPLEPLPTPHKRRLGRFHAISLLVGLGALAWINGLFRGGAELTTTYALCSPHGTTNIHTVDANDTKAQCLVVRDERFLYTCAYGECACRKHRVRPKTH